MIYHDLEAKHYHDSLEDSRAKGALVALHQVLLECYGSPLHILRQPLKPDAPLDNMIFYQAAALAFSTWCENARQSGSPCASKAGVINATKAIEFAQEHPLPRVKSFLNFFLQILSTLSLPPNAAVDANFCCRILAAFIEKEEIWQNIQTGALARDFAESRKDFFNWWLHAWFQPGSPSIEQNGTWNPPQSAGTGKTGTKP